MFLLNGTIVASPTDLAVAVTCEFALLRRVDVATRLAQRLVDDDLLLARLGALGEAHEQKELAKFRKRYGDDVVDLTSHLDHRCEQALQAANELTLQHLRDGAPLLYQATFFDGTLSGRSDFLELRDDGYAVLDSKLARRAKVPALLQLAAYADQLHANGISVHPQAELLLGDGSVSSYALEEVLPVYRRQRERMSRLVSDHLATGIAADWRQVRACGRCSSCEPEAESARDVLLVAGLRTTQRVRLAAAGLTTVEELAASTDKVAGMSEATITKLRHQAQLQAAQDQTGEVVAVIHDAQPIQALPAPDQGDLFFDFEGDPLWDNGDGKGGLEYLFGVVEADTGAYRYWEAHDRKQEHAALADFLAYVVKRRKAHPNMHIYHYAAYERVTLARLAGHAEHGEDVIDDLFRGGVLIDLFGTVRASVRVSQRSYSIKKFEPLYMGDELRDGVSGGGESVAEYARVTALREVGNDEEAQKGFAGILDYNRYDCVSTHRLRNWLLMQVESKPAAAAAAAAAALEAIKPIKEAAGPDPLAVELREQAAALGAEHPDAAPLRLLASALGYHDREDKPVWWEYFARLRDPVDEWADQRGVFVVEEVLADSGFLEPVGRLNSRRHLRLAGRWAQGSTPDGKSLPVFSVPVPEGFGVPTDGCRATGTLEELELNVAEDGRDVVEFSICLANKQMRYDNVPVALVPGKPVATASQQKALRELGEQSRSGLPVCPATALLRRETTPALPRPAGAEDLVETLVEAVRQRVGSYVAVQGPPGTGKTFNGARVVARLVAEGWRIGVVAQSHAVVGNFLDAVVKAGVPSERVAKKAGDAAGIWTTIKDSDYAAFLDDHADGCVLGGTAWDLTNPGRFARGELDLLVVDEAGQFSLGNTLACSVSAQRLLLLGDPQQLPQVSKGTHGEPVDVSALSWLMGDSATVPDELGYFLPETWRMHPELTRSVSRLSYEDRLASAPGVADCRQLEGLAPGLHQRPIIHEGNDTSSSEEAAEVLRCVQEVLGLEWREDDLESRPLKQADLLVVAAYNAQVQEVRRQMDDAGLVDVRVGTVDKLQGQEAPVVVMTLAASSATDVPRGLEFLLSRNRLNVAVSRAQWATFLVHSPALADHVPPTPTGLTRLGAYLRLLG